MTTTTRDLILRKASRLFAERGYAGVSIRDVAAAAEVSPALVMKHVGSKAALFDAAATFEPLPPLGPVPDDELGAFLVGDLVDRIRAGGSVPLLRGAVLVLPAPEPDQVRERFHTVYADPLVERLGGGEQARARADAALSALLGLAVGARILGLCGPGLVERDDLVRVYGAAVQGLIAP
ncbi:TetR/AcrR family transcriptional regulator [Arsenicicoccus piscis]|uniref:TetR family transcriptional regulator n=1 Tax=Arsenicicoccus piscis TaxID=673954 RepID=A0ABQ6HU12_9MICO|nr:helix-turn-helix domain-containing protein [Arsenicicoccus piscis]MCH8629300.1 TetR/AcrR family transcriptional regulator [Arsenicicoccus piscis]GMA19738.1 TetR family transcriptional regulator [Arsenicicoccus piscis]GMA22033.1 TetR family transcriptional regulator [Arsenicicoccus piscis]